MENNILKWTVIISVIVFIGCGVIYAADTNSSSDYSVLTLSKSGIVMNYPSDWGYSQSTSNYSIMAISKLDSIDSLGIGQVNINVEKRAIDGGDFETFVNSTYATLEEDSSFELVSSGAVMLADKSALEYVYTCDDDGVEKEHKAVWFEKGGQAYVLLYSAPEADFDSNLYVFDFILSDIQIT